MVAVELVPKVSFPALAGSRSWLGDIQKGVSTSIAPSRGPMTATAVKVVISVELYTPIDRMTVEGKEE